MKIRDHVSPRELEAKHHALDLMIHELDRRGFHITPPEREKATLLKKLRLITKDQIEQSRS